MNTGIMNHRDSFFINNRFLLIVLWQIIELSSQAAVIHSKQIKT